MNSPWVDLPPQKPDRELYLIGFRLDPAAEEPQFYTLIGADGDEERPVTRGDRVLFFRKPSAAARALAACDNGFRHVRPLPTELELLCDIAGAMHVANQEDEDADGLLFEVIGVFDDVLRAVRLTPPAQFTEVLSGVAGRLTEAQEFASYLAATETARERLEDALLWCVGAIMLKSSWVE
jgi:hypothetical protein